MLSFEVYNYYYFVNNKLKETEEIFELLFKWKEEYSDTCEQILSKVLTCKSISAGDGTHYVIPNGGIVKSFDETMGELQKNFNIITVTIKYGEVKKEIENYKIKNNILPDYIEEFFRYTDFMLEVYQSWIQNLNNKQHAIRLGEEIIKYEKVFLTCKKIYENFLNLYTDDKNMIEKEKIFEIQLLDVKYDLKEFYSILESINEIYYELGNIMYANDGGIVYEKLSIVKIESGSVWSKLFGDENILSTLAKFLNKTIDLIFNKYTLEGKLNRQQGINKTIKESLEMAELLKEKGYNVDESEENIQKAFLCSTKHLVNIATKSSKIVVNGEVHELKSELKQKYIEDNKINLLEEGKK